MSLSHVNTPTGYRWEFVYEVGGRFVGFFLTDDLIKNTDDSTLMSLIDHQIQEIVKSGEVVL